MKSGSPFIVEVANAWIREREASGRCIHGIALDHPCGHCPASGRDFRTADIRVPGIVNLEQCKS